MQANATSATPAPAAMAVSEGKVNLNTADAATLQKELAGIGMAKAKAIVAFREENGAFTSVDELLEVQGIGKALVDRNRDRLAVN
ncbi:ComEA family DNA-binding protein [Pseudomonas sp. DC3000-4b1]|uniref:ComEA family DNA-binding protein n=1 Tax=unclassified Pseudomonas TaxID=196821 RepID=UPI003CE9E47F